MVESKNSNQMVCIKGNNLGGLTPVISSWMELILSQGHTLKQLMRSYGSPVNILHMPPFEKNICGFKSIFDSLDMDYKIYYARKANKCKAFISHAIKTGIGIDTASERELDEALQMGALGKDLVLTSAIKTRAQIELAIENGVTIILDNADECDLVQKIADEKNQYALVGFRVSGFLMNNNTLYSRFGMDISEVVSYAVKNVGPSKKYSRLDLKGLHFHLDGYSIPQRSKALLQTIKVARQLNSSGFSIHFIDIGGGILVNYLSNKREWESFQTQLKNSLLGKISPVTFQNDGLGYKIIDGKLTGKLNTYPYYNDTHKSEFLKKILQYGSPSGNSVAQILNEEEIQLRIEPGRSLVDQCGITVARVIHRKPDPNGDWLVGLEMNMSQMMSSSADFLLDPYIIYQQKPEKVLEIDVYFTGAYCLERDILLKRKIRLPSLPDKGDLVVFVNTAGYMMHFFETEAHRFALAENLIVKKELDQLLSSNVIPDQRINPEY